ncbi:MAG: hypothetical protein ACTTJ3_07725 [Treponema sp.]
MRKGRFDELFHVALPDAEERRRIFQIHLQKRGKLTPKIDVLKLLKKTKGFSGTDIENVVKEAVENAFCSSDENRTVTTDKLLEVISHTKSISETLKDKIDELKKQYEKFNFKKANGKVEHVEKPKTMVEHQAERGNTSLYEKMFGG